MMYIGVPFLTAMTLGSFAFSKLTQIRYDFHDKRTKALSKREELGLHADKREFNLQEEYWKLTSEKDLDEWDFVRVPRPAGASENVWEKK